MNSDTILDHLQTYYNRYEKDQLDHLADIYPDTCSFTIDYTNLQRFDIDLAEMVDTCPDSFLKCAHNALLDMELGVNKCFDCHIRIKNYPDKIAIKDIRARHIGKFFSVEAIIRKSTAVLPRTILTVFVCQRCNCATYVPQLTKSLTLPLECSNDTCATKGPYNIDVGKSITIDYQKHRVQELPEVLRGGRQPESLDLLITNDLAGTVQPGDTAIFSGILRTIPTIKDRDMELEFEVNHIEKEVGYDDLDISAKDIEEIIEFSVRPDLMDCLIHSIAPAVFNMDPVKEAILYHLFSGVRKMANGTVLRGDIHVLLVGDPGIAKSQLLKYAIYVSPRGVYVSGKSSTAVGLTAAAVKDDFNGGGWSLEVGALPMASGGTVAIDEMGQMSIEDLSALHEALEQQTVTVSKAGIYATLLCRCGAFGAANPKNGIFDTNLPLAEQVSLPPALLSRFDIVFCLTDDKDPIFDDKLASNILESHKNWQESDTTICIEPEFLRKYIAYARSFNPTLSHEASVILKDFYLSLRKRTTKGSLPVTPRQLEACIRISEASARIRLSDTVSVEDAQQACNILTESFKNTVMDDSGNFDFGKLVVGQSASQRDTRNKITTIIKHLQSENSVGFAYKTDIIKMARDEGIAEDTTKDIIRTLSMQGEIVSLKKNYWKFV